MYKYIALIDANNNVENVSIVQDNHHLANNEIQVSSAAMLKGTYIPALGKFRLSKPFPSWVESEKFEDLHNEVLGWNPPVAKPEPDSDGDTTRWAWDEDTTSWVVM